MVLNLTHETEIGQGRIFGVNGYKILMWDQDGLSLWSKRLESGTFEKITGSDDGDFEIDAAELIMMLRGVQIQGTHRRKRYRIDEQAAA